MTSLTKKLRPSGLLSHLDQFLLRVAALLAEGQANRVDGDTGAASVLDGVFPLETAVLVVAIGQENQGSLALDAVEVVEGEDDAVVESRPALGPQACQSARQGGHLVGELDRQIGVVVEGHDGGPIHGCHGRLPRNRVRL